MARRGPDALKTICSAPTGPKTPCVFPKCPAEALAKDIGWLPGAELSDRSPAFTRRVPELLTLLALHGRVIANFLEADVPQVEDTRHNL